MASPIRIHRMSVHYVDKSSDQLQLSRDEQDISAFNTTVIDFLCKLIHDVWKEAEKGAITSAKYSESGSSLVKDSVIQLLDNPDTIFDVSINLARRLFAESPRNASPGLLSIIYFSYSSIDQRFIAILKIERSHEEKVALNPDELTQITVEDLPNLLLEKIQKGAITPHPHKANYDLKLVDRQSKDAARYFREDFLGCTKKRTDDYQSTKLLPQIRTFALENGLPLNRDVLPRLVSDLLSENRDITTPFVIRKCRELNVMGQDFDPAAFQNFLLDERGLGEIDIPRSKFLRGKVSEDRKLIFTFKDPKNEGITISGPIDKLQNIFRIENNSVVFSITTTLDGYDVDWN